MLAALWNRPQATFVSKIALSGSTATVTREVDSGLETVEVDLPAVVTVDLRLNEPRFVKLPDIMKAKRKPLDVLALDALGVAVDSNVRVTRFAPPAQRARGIMVGDAAQLVQELRNRGLI
jgi:electron transfer flavoprotein beta subunit